MNACETTLTTQYPEGMFAAASQGAGPPHVRGELKYMYKIVCPMKSLKILAKPVAFLVGAREYM
jgi:hypothetical protein